nr:hypothetical protein HK105_007194 [Polyrhizophydium stewartii]
MLQQAAAVVNTCTARRDGAGMAKLLVQLASMPASQIQLVSAQQKSGKTLAQQVQAPAGYFFGLVINYLAQEPLERSVKLEDLLRNFTRTVFTAAWHRPLFKALCDLVVARALESDAARRRNGMTPADCSGVQTALTEYTSLAISRKPGLELESGLLVAVNALCRMSFVTGELHMCTTVIANVEKAIGRTVHLAEYPKADQVTFYFNVGKLRLQSHDFYAADENLSLAASMCHADHFENKRLIMLHLVVARIIRGCLPTIELLEKHGLDDVFADLVHYIKTGNYFDYLNALEQRRRWFMRHWLYTIMKERVRLLMCRNLFQQSLRVYQEICPGKFNVPISFFLAAIRLSGLCEPEVDQAEVECLFASLIEQRYILGRIDHFSQNVVLSKKVDKAKMAMEYRHTIQDAHPKAVMCVQYNPFRREIYTAGEDSLIKVWESESGKFLGAWTKHIGWVTNLLYCKQIKVLFSCSIDGTIIAWGSNGAVLQKIQTGAPIYCLAYNSRRQQLMAGQNKKVRLFQLINSDDNHGTTDVLERRNVVCLEHSDVVSCIVSCEGRFYSAGYDRKIVIYDVPHHGDLKLRVSSTIKDAHDAAISCMVFGKDADNSWCELITGSFDRVVKLWSLDGNLMQRFDGFKQVKCSALQKITGERAMYADRTRILAHSDTISSLCYVVPTQTLWVTANSATPVVYDPRSGINVSDFVRTDDERFHPPGGTFSFKYLMYIPENNEVIGISTRRSLVIWRYNSVAPLTVLPGHADIAECLTFTSKEPLLIFSGGDDGIIRKWERLQLNTFMYSQETLMLPKDDFGDADAPEPDRDDSSSGDADRGVNVAKSARPGIVSLFYYEELDVLVSGYEDSRILLPNQGVWGYNEESIKFLPETSERDGADPMAPGGGNQLGSDSVSNRVAGMTLKASLLDHKDAVTGLISTGWDRRICVWDLQANKLQDVFRHAQPQAYGSVREELAADGIILSLDYSPERNEFGYASSDKLAYIRKFSPVGSEMTLTSVLQGHEAEVTQIRWHRKEQQWITGSEDRTIRLWPAEGIPCLRIINNDGPVTALCIDAINGCLITGSQDKVIRVFDIDKKDEIVQKNVGHSDEIRSLIHIPVRNQYVSASWDNTVRIWNAYLKKGQRRIAAKANMTFYTNAEEEEQLPTFSELNPLIVPKLLTKPVFVKDFILEKLPTKDEDYGNTAEKTALEEELRQTFNDLDAALNADQKLAHGAKGTGKPRIAKALPKRKAADKKEAA